MKKLLLILSMVAATVSAQPLPNASFTPGLADPKLTKEVICDKSFRTTSIRNVPDSVKKQVYKNYNVVNHDGICAGTQGCEVDHLISLELGGSNDIKNLWPEPYMGPWNAHQKDQLENKLHSMVCTGKITLSQAQYEIATDWISAYRKYITK